jgi:hypothetical protein
MPSHMDLYWQISAPSSRATFLHHGPTAVILLSPPTMNTSEFMDKQIQGLKASGTRSGSSLAAGSLLPSSIGTGGGLTNLMGPDPQMDVESMANPAPQWGRCDEVLPSYDFQLLRHSVAATGAVPTGLPPKAATSWGHMNSRPHPLGSRHVLAAFLYSMLPMRVRPL